MTSGISPGPRDCGSLLVRVKIERRQIVQGMIGRMAASNGGVER